MGCVGDVMDPDVVPPPFPYIVGSGRSGTSLLRTMLDSHPDIAIPNETHFVVSGGRRRSRYERAGGFDIERFLADFGPLICRELRWQTQDVRDALSRAEAGSFPDAVRGIFSRYAAQRGKPRYGNKSPVHALALPDIARLFPEARFIHIIRDGRDVALSYLDAPVGPQTLETATLKWRRFVRRARQGARFVGPGRYLEVRYEELTGDPAAVLTRVCDFIELHFDDGMLRYHERVEEAFGGPLPRQHRNLHRPPSRIRDWREQLTGRDVGVVELIAGPLLDELGYGRTSGRPSLSLRLATGRRVFAAEAARTLRSVEQRLPGRRMAAAARARKVS